VIYFSTVDGLHIAVIDQRNVDLLTSGKPMKTPDKKFLVVFTPSVPAVQAKIMPLLTAKDGFDINKFGEIIRVSLLPQ
jgi:hypothetical protein